jgi:hypothetical protein
MAKRFLPVFFLGSLPLLSAHGGAAWDGALSVTGHYREVEVGCFPDHLNRGRGYLLGANRFSLGLVFPREDHPTGVRLHWDTLGADQGWLLQAGLILSGGQDLGAGIGARVGVGYRFNRVFRLALLADGVAGSRKSQGSAGLQAAFTF